jgi:hypothetical protein
MPILARSVEVMHSWIVNNATPLNSNRNSDPFGSFHIEIGTIMVAYKMGIELNLHGKPLARRKFE